MSGNLILWIAAVTAIFTAYQFRNRILNGPGGFISAGLPTNNSKKLSDSNMKHMNGIAVLLVWRDWTGFWKCLVI